MERLLFEIEKIENVHVYTDQSASEFYNNVTIIEQKNGLTIIDTFIKKETMNNFIDLVKKYKKPIDRIILTHWHIDHSLGAYFLKEYDLYSNLECKNQLVDFVAQHQERLRGNGVIEEGISVVIPNKVFEKELRIPMDDNWELILESFPGHSFDSIIIHYKNILIVGDNLVGKEVDVNLPPVIPPDTLKSKPEHLIEAINYIEKLNSKYIIYGHGKRLSTNDIILDNRTRIAELILSVSPE